MSAERKVSVMFRPSAAKPPSGVISGYGAETRSASVALTTPKSSSSSAVAVVPRIDVTGIPSAVTDGANIAFVGDMTFVKGSDKNVEDVIKSRMNHQHAKTSHTSNVCDQPTCINLWEPGHSRDDNKCVSSCQVRVSFHSRKQTWVCKCLGEGREVQHYYGEPKCAARKWDAQVIYQKVGQHEKSFREMAKLKVANASQRETIARFEAKIAELTAENSRLATKVRSYEDGASALSALTGARYVPPVPIGAGAVTPESKARLALRSTSRPHLDTPTGGILLTGPPTSAPPTGSAILFGSPTGAGILPAPPTGGTASSVVVTDGEDEGDDGDKPLPFGHDYVSDDETDPSPTVVTPATLATGAGAGGGAGTGSISFPVPKPPPAMVTPSS